MQPPRDNNDTIHQPQSSNNSPNSPDRQQRWSDQLSLRYMKDRIENERAGGGGQSQSQRRRSSNVGGMGMMMKRPSSMADLMGGLPLNMKPPVVKNSKKPQDDDGGEEEGQSTSLSTRSKEEKETNDAETNSATKEAQETSTTATTSSQYKILTSLPSYTLGEPLHATDTILVSSLEATAYARSHLQPNDCAFVQRSDGTFTYAIYEGTAGKKVKDGLSFRVDERGHFKILPGKQFLSRVKIPVVPVALIGKVPELDGYVSLLVGNDEDKEEEEEEGGVKNKVEASTSAHDLNKQEVVGSSKGSMMLPRSTSMGQLGQTTSLPHSTSVGQLSQAGGSIQMAKYTPRSKRRGLQQQEMITSQGNNAGMDSSEDVLSTSNNSTMAGGNITMGMGGNQMGECTPKSTTRRGMDSNDILSRMVTANNNNGMMGIRVASMQDFRQSRQLNSVPETSSSQLRMKALPTTNNQGSNSAAAFTLTRNNTTSGSLAGLSMKSPNNSNGSLSSGSAANNGNNGGTLFGLRKNSTSTTSMASGGRLGHRTASTGTFSSNGTMIMPRNVTLKRITEEENRASGNSANESWEFANVSGTSGTSRNNSGGENPLLTMAATRGASMNNNLSDNPLLRMAASRGGAGLNHARMSSGMMNSMSDNPLLKMMAANQKVVKKDGPLLKVGVDGSTITTSTSAMNDDNPPPFRAERRGTIVNVSPLPKNLNDDTSHASDITSGMISTNKKSKFSLGDRIPTKSMPRPLMNEMKLTLQISKLNPNDYAWVRRSGGYWGYSIVKAKNSLNMVFMVNDNGDMKTVDLVNCDKYVRILEDEELIPESVIVKATAAEAGAAVGSAVKQSSSDERSKSNEERSGSQQSGNAANDSRSKENSKDDSQELVASGGEMNETLSSPMRPAVASRRDSMSKESSEDDGQVVVVAPGGRQMNGTLSSPVRSVVASRRGSDPPEVDFSVTVTAVPAMSARPRRRASATVSSMIPTSQGGDIMSGGMSNRMQRRGSTGIGMLGPAAKATSPSLPRTMSGNGLNRMAGLRSLPRTMSGNGLNQMAGSGARQLIGNGMGAAGPSPTIIQQVECKTEDGGTKMVPMYKAGMDVYYKSNDTILSARILDVHLDDLLEPYYSVRLEDGREKQTDNHHIMLSKEPTASVEGAGMLGGTNKSRMQRRGSTGMGALGPITGVTPQYSLPRTMSGNGLNRMAGSSGAMQPNGNDLGATAGADTTNINQEVPPSGDTITKSDPQSKPALIVQQVECKTEDGGTKMVPMYKAGMDVFYKGPNNTILSAHILDVHLDDLLEPYYSIRLEDGREKQTDNYHIMLSK